MKITDNKSLHPPKSRRFLAGEFYRYTSNKSMHRLLSIVIILYGSKALACSGPGAGKTIFFNNIGSYLFAFLLITAISLILFLRHRRKAKSLLTIVALIFGAVLVVFHPAWWMSAYSGDCGYTKFLLSGIELIVFLIIFLIEYFRYLKIRRLKKATVKSSGADGL